MNYSLIPLRLALVSFVATIASSAADAHACTATYCAEAAAYPATATIPANAGGVFLDPGFRLDGLAFDIDKREVSLALLPPGASVPTVLERSLVDLSINSFLRYAVRTDAPLPVGATLTLSAIGGCAEGPDGGVPSPSDVRSWTVAEAAPLPTTLGTLTVTVVDCGTVPQATNLGSCDTQHTTSYADVTLVPSAEASAWADALIYETVVDDVTFLPVVTLSPFNGFSAQSQAFGGSWVGRGVDRVFANCGDVHGGVLPGTHGISMRGRLPDGTVVTTEKHEVTLTCPEPSTPDGGLVPDAGAADAVGPAPVDAGGCRVGAGATAGTATAFVLAALGLALMRRRRR